MSESSTSISVGTEAHETPQNSRSATDRQGLEDVVAERLEQERQRLAKELHDTIGQSLTAIYLNVKFVERKLEKGGGGDVGEISALGETIHRAVEELHGIMQRLLSGGDLAPGGMDVGTNQGG